MQRDSSTRRPSRRPLWVALGLLTAALAGVVLFLLLRPGREEVAPGAKAPAAAGAEKRARYRNRALLRGAHEAPPEARPTISGHVYTTDGSTLADVTVVASAFEVAGNVLTTAGTAKSDEAGRFELTLPDGTYQLSASVEGYGTTSTTAHSGQTASLVLPKSGVIEGRVLDERGEPVRRFSIDVLSPVTEDDPAPPPLFSRVFESPDGSYRVAQLPSWPIILRATTAEHAPAFSPFVRVRPGEVEKVDLTLPKGCTLTGRAVDPSGAPLPGVFVDAESLLAAGQMSNVALEAAAQAQSEDDGSFVLPNVPKGTIAVRGYDGANAVSTVNVDVAGCDDIAPVKLVMSRGGSIAGVARGADGAPLAGVRLTLLQRRIGFVNTMSDAEGRYRFDQIPSGPIRMTAQHGERTRLVDLEVEEGKETEQDVSLPPGGTSEIRGRVTAGGQPLPGVRLTLATPFADDNSIGLYSPVTAEDGSYRVSAISPGLYMISVESTIAGAGVQVKPGEVATVDLRVPDAPPAGGASPPPPPPQ
ncbi:carboxypeptidase regulatory-like domain-containing protein [Sorangium sp. So ce176]|uniref:carboxypeptidase regulatory-like domain-containing protein n=1 Tax=Sorangium sp. So ce176 TaxID=3133286 RepID=UPI003F63A58C